MSDASGPAPDDARVEEAVRRNLDALPPGERRVAEVVVDDPEVVAFGTVAEVAARAGTSGPTVVRLAHRLGYEGFVALQRAIRGELTRRLRPAADRIRSADAGDPLARTLEVETRNVRETLEDLDEVAYRRAVELLAGARRVFVLGSEQTAPVAASLATELRILRDDVELVAGSEFRVGTLLAPARDDDVLVVLDLHRYETWLLRVLDQVASVGMTRIAITDHRLSPLGRDARVLLPVAAGAAGPFDSMVGALALVNALVAGVARELRGAATTRLRDLDDLWVSRGLLRE